MPPLHTLILSTKQFSQIHKKLCVLTPIRINDSFLYMKLLLPIKMLTINQNCF